MRISGTMWTVAALLVLAAAGAGGLYVRNGQELRRLQLQRQAQEAKLKARQAEAEEKAAEARREADEARKAEARQKRAEADAKKAAALAEEKRLKVEELKAQRTASETAKAASEAAKAAADAETAKAEAAKAASEAAKAAADAKAAAEDAVLRKLEAERKLAAAKAAETADARRIAEAALAKSEVERKTAEANAAAERDRRLRMYQRAGTSRAEMLALKRAERLLALEEAGLLPEDGAGEGEAAAAQPAPAAEEQPATNAVVAVNWPDPATAETPAGARLAEWTQRRQAQEGQARRRRTRSYIRSFGELIAAAEKEARAADAAHYRRTLVALVPEYVDVYADLVEEARQAGRAEEAGRICDALMALVPDWQRVTVIAKLIGRDEAYYSKALAGRVTKGEFVRAFRKLYDAARRDKGDMDERDRKVAHICQVLATYVPGFESEPDWK